MKVLFAGPTLHGVATPGQLLDGTDIHCRPPARQGDIARAVIDGATMIGLVDGRYEDVAAPWHKEILYALSRNVSVLGGASLGALRAAECAPYGMLPVGHIARRYISGDLVDDAAVAQLHAPPEFGCTPLTEALVNVEATIEQARKSGVLSLYVSRTLDTAARRLFFKDRIYPSIIGYAGFSGDHAVDLSSILKRHRRDIKREDALQLVGAMQSISWAEPSHDWTFRETATWRRFMRKIEQVELERG